MPGKYTPDQLQSMAQRVVQDEATGGSRAIALYITMHQRTGLHPDTVRGCIMAYAKGDGL